MTGDAGPEHLTPETVDFGRVAKVSSRSKPTDVLLARCTVQLDVPRSDLADDWHDKTYIAFDTHVASRDGERFEVQVAFIAVHFPGLDPEIHDLPGPDGDPEPVVLIEARFELRYQLEAGADVDWEDLEHFAAVNSTMHAWSYWREFAQSMTTRMGLRPLVIGTFKIPSVYDPDEADSPDTADERPDE